MSEYKNFNRCVICRSRKNFINYSGEFEVTMLINTLYMTVMFILENRRNLHFIKSKKILGWLAENDIVDKCGNDFSSDDTARYLRNGLAHFNIKIIEENGIIQRIRFDAKNRVDKTICKNPCSNPKCISKKLKEKDEAICIFDFSKEQLNEFTQFIVEEVLSNLPSDICKKCKYREV